MVYRILSIDGGGIRGVFALGVLDLIVQEIDPTFLEKIDCFAGTSTGAIIVSALMQGYTPKELLRFYSIFGRSVFPKRREVSTGEALYSPRLLKKVLQFALSEKVSLGDLKKDLVIPSCKLKNKNINRWNYEVYDNYNREKAKEHTLVDVALRSSAAPIYFPSYQEHVDGGVYAVNPSMVAFARAIDETGGNKKIEEIRLLSIGTGINPVGIEEETNWCAEKWMSPYQMQADYPLFSLVTEMGAHLPDYPLRQILKGNYLRINKVLPQPIELDDYKKIPLLAKTAKSVKEDLAWIQQKEWIQNNILQ